MFHVIEMSQIHRALNELVVNSRGVVLHNESGVSIRSLASPLDPSSPVSANPALATPDPEAADSGGESGSIRCPSTDPGKNFT